MRSTERGSSSSTPFGSRPASGLSKRRTQFRGPPPSFYRNGSWGEYRAKRQSQADATAGNNDTVNLGNGGLGLGHGKAGLNADIPHFDREGHSRTQDQQDQRRRKRHTEENARYEEGGSMFVKFALVTAVIAFAFSIPGWFEKSRHRFRKVKEDSEI